MSHDPAPKPRCRCDVCVTLRANAALKERLDAAVADGPITPFTQDWDDLMALVSRVRGR